MQNMIFYNKSIWSALKILYVQYIYKEKNV